jgi:signal transduction histidine kinase
VAIGKLRLELRVIELAPVVEEALERVKPGIAARQHRLSVQISELPVYVEGDGGRLAQVFSNLLTNAAKYTEPGGDIQVTLSTSGSRAVVTIRDTGRGLDESDMTYLFDLFFQPERTLDRALTASRQ